MRSPIGLRQRDGARLQQGLQLEKTFGHPPDTALMSFEGCRSKVWVMERVTADLADVCGLRRTLRQGFNEPRTAALRPRSQWPKGRLSR